MREKKTNEFRKLNDKEGRGHPTYIYAKVGKRFKFIGITHAEITDGIQNIPLDKNPNPKDEKKAYMRPKTGEKNRSKFGSKLLDWELTESDKPKAKEIISKSKKGK